MTRLPSESKVKIAFPISLYFKNHLNGTFNGHWLLDSNRITSTLCGKFEWSHRCWPAFHCLRSSGFERTYSTMTANSIEINSLKILRIQQIIQQNPYATHIYCTQCPQFWIVLNLNSRHTTDLYAMHVFMYSHKHVHAKSNWMSSGFRTTDKCWCKFHAAATSNTLSLCQFDLCMMKVSANLFCKHVKYTDIVRHVSARVLFLSYFFYRTGIPQIDTICLCVCVSVCHGVM